MSDVNDASGVGDVGGVSDDLVARLVAAWNAHDAAAVGALCADHVVWDDPVMGEPARGRAAVVTFLHTTFTAFPDLRYALRGAVAVASSAEGTTLAYEWRTEGTHTGPLTPPGFAPTGRRVTFEGAEWVQADAQGRITRITTYLDVRDALGQFTGLNLRPRPGSLGERIFVAVQRLVAPLMRR